MVPRDFEQDYTGAEPFANLRLELPSHRDRDAAFGQIESALAISRATLEEIFTAIADGRHVLLYGPPGTGKTTLADLVARYLFRVNPRAETATADWTSFETVGGLQLVLRDGKEQLEPQPGVITRAIVDCLASIVDHEQDPAKPQATWLILDELNRANMDASFGPVFTALDPAHRRVSLPFFETQRRELLVPSRFRIIGTMNSYDKNFLFRLSYALMRRFALIPIDPPSIDADAAPERRVEEDKLWDAIAAALNEHGAQTSSGALRSTHSAWLMAPLFDGLVQAIRNPESLNRGIGFAQIAAAARHAALVIHLGLASNDASGHTDALDRGVRSAIVPQLEGLPNNALAQFIKWWTNQSPPLDALRLSIQATKQLMRGTELFTSG
jgi:MoxR-like ATPase